jgi:hypothetical protein
VVLLLGLELNLVPDRLNLPALSLCPPDRVAKDEMLDERNQRPFTQTRLVQLLSRRFRQKKVLGRGGQGKARAFRPEDGHRREPAL